MDIKVYTDASVNWIMKPPQNPDAPGEVSSGIATSVVVVAWRECDSEAIIKEIPSRGEGQIHIVSNAEIDAVLLGINELGGNIIYNDNAIACRLLKRFAIDNSLVISRLSRKSYYMKVVDSLSKSSYRGNGYVALNASRPERHWIYFVKHLEHEPRND